MKMLATILLLPALALAQGVQRDQRAAIRPPDKAIQGARRASGPLLACGATAVACVTWNGTALADAKANNWTMVGTVPQVAAAPPLPAGAGVFSDANHYTLGSGNDVLDFTTSFTCHIVYSAASYAAVMIPLANGNTGSAGWSISVRPTGGVVRLTFRDTVGSKTASTVTTSSAGINVLSVGRDAGNLYAKLNLGPTASIAAGTAVAATASPALLGRYASDGSAFVGSIYGVTCSTDAFTDAAAIAAQSAVKARVPTVW